VQDAFVHFLSEPFPYMLISCPGLQICLGHGLVIHHQSQLGVLFERPGAERGLRARMM
jgi:hypothetical protein